MSDQLLEYHAVQVMNEELISLRATVVELVIALEGTTKWIAEECQPDAEYVGEGHNWNMGLDERRRGVTLLAQARAALGKAEKAEEPAP